MLLIAGCATPMPRKDDPYENFNRKMYAFNEFADRVAIRPVAVGYRKITNDTTRRLISNFFANIESPITIANDLLQADPKEAFTATSRLVINTTIGVLGLFDPASEMSIDAQHDRFRRDPGAMGRAGRSVSGAAASRFDHCSRCLRAFPVDRYLFDPLSWYAAVTPSTLDAQYLPTVVYLVTLRSSAIDAEGLLEGAYDPYVFYRDAYRQRRLYKIYRGNPPMEAIQSLQGVDDVDVDVDKLLEEQEKYEQAEAGRQTDNAAATPHEAALSAQSRRFAQRQVQAILRPRTGAPDCASPAVRADSASATPRRRAPAVQAINTARSRCRRFPARRYPDRRCRPRRVSLRCLRQRVRGIRKRDRARTRASVPERVGLELKYGAALTACRSAPGFPAPWRPAISRRVVSASRLDFAISAATWLR